MSASRPRIVKSDDHVADMTILLHALPDAVRRAGVIHVGAHRGEEVPVFRQFGFRHVALIDANPDHARAMSAAFDGDPDVVVLNTAVGDRVGTATFHLHTSRSGSTEPASLLEMARFKEIVQTLHTPERRTVPITTLDALIDARALDPTRYSMLVVDVQGAEDLVFRGARRTLPSIDAIVTEVNLIQLYEGAPLEDELLATLHASGFERRETVYHELYTGDTRFVAWGECLLTREGLR